MPKRRRLEPGSPWVELTTTPRTGRTPIPRCSAPCSASSTSSARSKKPFSSWPARDSSTAPRTPASARRAARSARSSVSTSTDAINGSHRGHHQFLAKALSHVSGGVSTRRTLVSADVQTVLQRTLAEILGLAQGYCRGRGGSMHLQWFEAGALGTNAIVGGGVPLGGRQRLGAEARRDHATSPSPTSVTGRANIGSVLESMNLASAWKMPLTFFIENNLYAVSTTVDGVDRRPRLSARALGFSIPCVARRRDGPARRPPRDEGGGEDAALGRRPGPHRGRGLPLLPPERAVPG